MEEKAPDIEPGGCGRGWQPETHRDWGPCLPVGPASWTMGTDNLKLCTIGKKMFRTGPTGSATKYVHIKSTTVYAPRRNWGSPQPPTRRLVCPLPPVSGGRGTLAGEKGVGRVPIPTRGTHCGTLYMYVLCGISCSILPVAASQEDTKA